MTERRPYQYVVLRYVHDAVSAEFVNIGVLALFASCRDDGPKLLGRFSNSRNRIKALFPNATSKHVQRGVAAIGRAVDDAKPELASLFSRASISDVANTVAPASDGCFQWSPPAVGLSKDPESTLNLLFHRYVVHHTPTTAIGRKDNDIWRPVEKMIAARKIPIKFEVRTIAGKDDVIELKHVWQNGQLHAYEPLSLDLANANEIKDKARRWRGQLDAAGTTSEPVLINFLVGKPSNEALWSSYRSAIDILNGAEGNPKVIEEQDFESFVEGIAAKVRRHHAGPDEELAAG